MCTPARFRRLRPLLVLTSIVFFGFACRGSEPPKQPELRQETGATLQRLGTTFNRAQTVCWISEQQFAVGRWDGTLSIFRRKQADDESGPVIVHALRTPGAKGIQLVHRVTENQLLTSHDDKALLLWTLCDDAPSFEVCEYDRAFGTAVSAITIRHQETTYVAAGHENGYVTIWRPASTGLSFCRAINLRSSDPISWQWQSWHIRGLAATSNGRLVTASEDGDLCLVSVADGEILFRKRYSPTATRGINDIAVVDDCLAVVNCSIGDTDRNLWLYRISNDTIIPQASTNLQLERDRDQVFCFSVELLRFAGNIHFLASTEEGLLWHGIVGDESVSARRHVRIADRGGAALAVQQDQAIVVAVAHRIHTFTLQPTGTSLTRPVSSTPH